jgi:hypothetical protein
MGVVHPPDRRRAGLLGLLAAATLLAGCGSGVAAPPRATGAASSTGSQVTAVPLAEQAAQYASNTPPASAQMVCSDEIQGEVADALSLDSVPPPASSWANHVYTCTYSLPMGQAVLSVEVTPSPTAATSRLAALRTELGATTEQPGLGEAGWSAPSGKVIAAKDNMVLTVDPTGLPDDLGVTHEHRLDFAVVIAAGVFSCWTGG